MFRKERRSSGKTPKQEDGGSRRKDDSKSERSSKLPGKVKSDKLTKDASSKIGCSDKPEILPECWAKCLWQHRPDKSKSDIEILPIPEPKQPGRRWEMSDEDYQELVSDWRERWEYWSSITCPCRRGYFCNAHMQWVSGADVRNGAAPSKEDQTPKTCHNPTKKYDGPKKLTRRATSQSRAQSPQASSPRGSGDDLSDDHFSDDHQDEPRAEIQGYPTTWTDAMRFSPTYPARTGLPIGSSFPDAQQGIAWSPHSPLYSAPPQMQTSQQPYQQLARMDLRDTQESYLRASGRPEEQERQLPSMQMGYTDPRGTVLGPPLKQRHATALGYPSASFTSQPTISEYSSPLSYTTEPAARGSYLSQPQDTAQIAATKLSEKDEEQGPESNQYWHSQSPSHVPISSSSPWAAKPRAYHPALGQTQSRRYDREDDKEDKGKDLGDEKNEDEFEFESDDRRQYTITPTPTETSIQTQTSNPAPRHRQHHRDRDRSKK